MTKFSKDVELFIKGRVLFVFTLRITSLYYQKILNA